MSSLSIQTCYEKNNSIDPVNWIVLRNLGLLNNTEQLTTKWEKYMQCGQRQHLWYTWVGLGQCIVWTFIAIRLGSDTFVCSCSANHYDCCINPTNESALMKYFMTEAYGPSCRICRSWLIALTGDSVLDNLSYSKAANYVVYFEKMFWNLILLWFYFKLLSNQIVGHV